MRPDLCKLQYPEFIQFFEKARCFIFMTGLFNYRVCRSKFQYSGIMMPYNSLKLIRKSEGLGFNFI